MKVTPVQNYRKANYPDKERIKADPALLLTMPKRWLRNGAACAALAATSMLLLSKSSTTKPLDEYEGALGSPMPPTLSTEWAAESLIREECQAAGVVFQDMSMMIQNMSMPVYFDRDGTVAVGEATLHGGITPDGFDAKKHIAYEFSENYADFEWSLEPDFDILISGNQKAGAESFAAAVNNDQPGMALVIFQETDTSDLRAQVRDFLAWLKAQGIE